MAASWQGLGVPLAPPYIQLHPSALVPPASHLPLRLGRAAPGYGCLRDAWSSQHRCWCHASNRGSSAQGARINLSRCFANIPENQSKLNCPLSPGLHYVSGRACSHPGRWQECSGIAYEILDNLSQFLAAKLSLDASSLIVTCQECPGIVSSQRFTEFLTTNDQLVSPQDQGLVV